MKAVRLHESGGPEKLVVEEIPTPEPGHGEIRVALQAAALNRRDVWITIGKYPGLDLPALLGSDGAGVIDAVGDGVDAGMVGREVVVYPAYEWGDNQNYYGPDFRVLGMPDMGTFADYIVVPQAHAFTKPEFLSWQQAAAVPLAGLTAWRALMTQAQLRPGETVFVPGIGGGVSTFVLLWAVNQGATVYVSSSSDQKLERAQSLGAAGGVNYKTEDWPRTLKKMTGGVDVIVDSSGGSAFNDHLNALKPAGRMVIYGGTGGNPPTGIEVAKFFFRQIRLIGSTMGSPQEFGAMLDFVTANKIEPVVDHEYPIDEAVAAHQHVLAAKQMGKVVLVP